MRKAKRFILSLVIGILIISVAGIYSDEGMWLLNNVPKKYLEQKYGFKVTDTWLEHVQKSAVRFPNGTGFFVSSDGLIETNHHIASSWLQKLSSGNNNYYENGFLAKTRDKELKCEGLEIVVLMNIEDVTDRINAGESIAGVVTLYSGGQYHLYQYKKYTDVRMVFAPENAIGFFGGDADNFEFPRYNLDIAFFRAYENNQPAKIKHFFKFSKTGLTENDLVFVIGNPGSTYRLNTVAALKFMRDTSIPFVLDYLRRMEILCQQFAYESDEHKRFVQDELFSIQNSRKAYIGMLRGLQDSDLMVEKERAEADLRKHKPSNAWDEIARVQKLKIDVYKKRFLVSWLNFLHKSSAKTPIGKEFEKAKLIELESFLFETFGYGVNFDPIQIQKEYNQILKIEQEAYTKIANAIFELKGDSIYPDATFTLRLGFGAVKGYMENGKEIPFQTTFGGAFGRAAKYKYKEPWKLPKSWLKKVTKIDLNTPLNFVSTLDITGGNSGSAVLNRKGEVVGIAFDSNIHGLANDFLYTEEQARAVSVSAQGIIEALKNIYNAKFLANEIGH